MSLHLVAAVMVVAALCHAGWNLLAGSLQIHRRLFLASLSAVMALLALPWAALHPPHRWWPLALVIPLRAGLQCGYVVGLARAYEVLDFSLAYPATRATGPVVATLLGIVVLGERPAPLGLVGVAVVSLAIGSLMWSGDRRADRASGDLRRWLWPLMTGAVIGCYSLVDKVGVSYVSAISYLAWSEGLTALLMFAPVVTRSGGRERAAALFRGHWRRVVGCGVLAAAGYGFSLYALTRTYVSYVSPLREMSVLFGVVLAGITLDEPRIRQRLVSACGIAVGVVLIALAL